MNYITKNMTTFLLGLTFLSSPVIFAEELYKWKDSLGKWHYSNVPPDKRLGIDRLPSEIEVAKNTRTIMFGISSPELFQHQEPTTDQILLQKKLDCRFIQNTMMTTAQYLHMKTDKDFKDMLIPYRIYVQEKETITLLENIGGEAEFYDDCINDFSNKPELKPLAKCIFDKPNSEERTSCLEKLPKKQFTPPF